MTQKESSVIAQCVTFFTHTREREGGEKKDRNLSRDCNTHSSFLIFPLSFPSPPFIALSQMVLTIVVLYFARRMRLVSFPDFSLSTFWKV
jgi:hypothetical protein